MASTLLLQSPLSCLVEAGKLNSHTHSAITGPTVADVEICSEPSQNVMVNIFPTGRGIIVST